MGVMIGPEILGVNCHPHHLINCHPHHLINCQYNSNKSQKMYPFYKIRCTSQRPKNVEIHFKHVASRQEQKSEFFAFIFVIFFLIYPYLT